MRRRSARWSSPAGGRLADTNPRPEGPRAVGHVAVVGSFG
jgi:hypothetical protein